MTSATHIPITNWIETLMTVMITVCSTSSHQIGAVSTWP